VARKTGANCQQGLDRTGLRFVPHAAIGLKADSAKISHFGSD
jgi:hypothetical protein